MKKILMLITLTLAMSLLMTSCGDDDDTSTGPSDLKIGEMTATVGGDSWSAQNAIFFNQTSLVSGIQIDISNPISGQKKTISIQLTPIATTPEVKSYSAICFYQETEGAIGSTTTETWADATGSCEVTEVTDTEIKATFSFTGTSDDDGSTKKVTGSFYVSRQ